MERNQGPIVIGVAPPEGVDQHLDAYGAVAIIVSREEVEALATGRVVAALMALTDTTERVRRFASSLWLRFDGYNDDPRELWDIPEVVRYFAAVHASWPHWFHFLVKHAEMFGVVLLLLLQRDVLGQETNGRLPTVTDPDALRVLMTELFGPLNTLYDMHAIGDDENRAMTDAVVDVAMQCVSGP